MSASTEPTILPRGGIVFPSAAGAIQYGSVPETIKDTMVMESGVPAIYVVPERLFSAERGISLAELEFPAYFNFFIKKGRTTIVCRPEQRATLEAVCSQSLFGPGELDREEFSPDRRSGLPELDKEMAHFRKNPFKGGEPMQLSDLYDFREIDDSGQADLGNGVVVAADHDGISILENGKRRFRHDGLPPLPERTTGITRFPKSYYAPLLGVSVIGSGHGFDPGNRTCGFIIWIEGQGIMVDPPVDYMDWLEGWDVDPKQVGTLILTHCHADHDAGTLQKIMQEGRITVYATPTVLNGFVTKYSALTGISSDAFRDLFDHVPIHTGEPMYLYGAEARFRYSLHSIPCSGFEIRHRNKSLIYPSDTLNEPGTLDKLHEQGVLSRKRRDSLKNFPWHHNLVLHEAGIPPIHTPIEYLATLGDEIKQRTLLVHVAASNIPDGSNLQVAPTGLENTVDLRPDPSPFQDALNNVDAMARVEIFSKLPAARAGEFLRMVKKCTFHPGERFIEAGTKGDTFYIVLTGVAAVIYEGKEIKNYTAYDYIGETALVLDTPRSADVVAKTHVEALTLTRGQFLHLIRNTEIPDRLRKLARQRGESSWDLMKESPVFNGFSANQMNQLEACMEPFDLTEGDRLDGDPILIESGEVRVAMGDLEVGRLGRGGFCGDAKPIMREEKSQYQFTVSARGRGYAFETDLFKEFLRNNPGAYLQLSELSHRYELAVLKSDPGK